MAWVNVCPVLRSRMLSRASRPMAVPETAGIRSRVVIRDNGPTVTATPTVTCLTMMARAVAPLRFEPTCTARGVAASSAVSPARYWPGVSGRHAHRNVSRSRVRPAA